MTKQATAITYAAGIFTAFWLIIAFLITSVEAVTYWTPGYYEKEYTKYQVLNDLPEMNMDDLLDVTDEMMAFLRGKRENLHVYTTMGGEYREFFNDREIAHMEDVRGLFIGGLWLRRIGILITLCFASLAYFWGHKSAERTAALKRLIPKSLCIGTGAVFAVSLVLIGIISTDFTKYFIVFHKIFFNNDLWVLDPRTDMLINIVPEGFFFDTAARIAMVFAGIVMVFFVGNLVLYKRAGR
nr:TIGR01906 family membrane protein [Clostridium sp. Marseille-P7770]